MDASIAELTMAIKGRATFVRRTNPFRTKEDIENEKREELAAKQAKDPVGARQQIAAFFKSFAIQKLPPRPKKPSPPEE